MVESQAVKNYPEDGVRQERAALERAPWERLFELFASELSAAHNYRLAGKKDQAQACLDTLRDRLAEQTDLRLADHLVSRDPEGTDSLNFQAAMTVLGGNWERAAALYELSLQQQPEQADVLHNVGCLYQLLKQTNRAIARFSELITCSPQFLPGYVLLAKCLHQKKFPREAAGLLRRVLKMRPEYKPALRLLITVLTDMGQSNEASDICRRALAYHPEQGEFFFLLTETAAPSPEDAAVTRAAELFAQANLTHSSKVHFGFGLAKVHDAVGEYDRAFDYLREANEEVAKNLNYDKSIVERSYAVLRQSFSSPEVGVQLMPAMELSNVDFHPMFVVGMPSAGSALLEQVFQNHPLTGNAGEVNYLSTVAIVETAQKLGSPYPLYMPKLDAEQAVQMRRSYLERLRVHDTGASWILDSLTGNFIHIGLIRALFPDAPIIHCRRDPVGGCFAIYQEHARVLYDYACSPDTLAHAWQQYDEMMRHWSSFFPNNILTVDYHLLVSDV